MATSRRIHALLEPRLFEAVKLLAERNGTTLSQEAHDLIVQALEFREDEALGEMAERRRVSWDPRRTLTAAEVRTRLARC